MTSIPGAHGSEDGVNWPGFSTSVASVERDCLRSELVRSCRDEGLIIQSEPRWPRHQSLVETTSGLWEEQFNWSLGALPAPEQGMIALGTPGSKVLEIAASTAAEYPYSLAIQNLAVDAPPGSANQLLLNDAGLNVPLEIAADFRLGANASLLSHHSALRAGAFHVSGRAMSPRAQLACSILCDWAWTHRAN
jgi:hypothetical protein